MVDTAGQVGLKCFPSKRLCLSCFGLSVILNSIHNDNYDVFVVSMVFLDRMNTQYFRDPTQWIFMDTFLSTQ